jgi:putative ABC transport system ATP-binding protein
MNEIKNENVKKMLEVKNLSKSFVVNKRQISVLKNINFNINQGEMVAIMGPSGSGKSTLLYSVSGMDSINAGEVIFGGSEITRKSPKKLAEIRLDDMGFIFQQMYMLKNLSILDNILLPAMQSKKNKLSKKAKTENGRSIMRKLGIAELADNDINEVSGGELQRACICRSIINNPKMIFADEPTGALNRSSSSEVMKELSLINKQGSTIMLVTHDVKVAAQCSRVMYIADGSILGDKTVAPNTDLRERERMLNNWLLEMGW